MGNSEVGHLNLGAGAVIRQDLTRINDAVLDRVLSENQAIVNALTCSERVHLVGLVSDGGVHSSLGHLKALLELAGRLSTRDLVVHCFTDGRDTPPEIGRRARRAARTLVLGAVAPQLPRAGARRLGGGALVCDGPRPPLGAHPGRLRPARPWPRFPPRGDCGAGGAARLRTRRDGRVHRPHHGWRGGSDPAVGQRAVLQLPPRPHARDRPRLGRAGFGEGDEQLPGWEGRHGIEPVDQYTTLTEYEEEWVYPIAFPPQRPAVTLASVLAAARASQLHVAETEKYAHVTYFFNGGEEAPYDGERRELAPSVRDVPTYDKAPAMSAREVTDLFLAGWREHRPRFAVINFANPDMVGHTGVIPAAVRAMETVDTCLREVVDAVLAAGGACLITADHGNAEHMMQLDGSPNTAHTSNPVPMIVTLSGLVLLQDDGILADVAPSVLALLGIAQPEEMSGRSLILGSRPASAR